MPDQEFERIEEEIIARKSRKKQSIILQVRKFDLFERVFGVLGGIPFNERVYTIIGSKNCLNDLNMITIAESKLREIMVKNPYLNVEIKY